MRNYKLAISNMDTAIELDPQNGLFYFIRGEYKHEAGRDLAACNDEEKATELGYSKASALVLYYCK